MTSSETGIVSGAGAGGGRGSDRRGGASEGEISRRTSRGASSYVDEGTGSDIDGEANRVPGSSLGRGASEGESSQGGRETSRGARSYVGEATCSERRGEDLATMNFAIVIFFSESSIVLTQRCSQDGCTIRRFDSRSWMNDGST